MRSAKNQNSKLSQKQGSKYQSAFPAPKFQIKRSFQHPFIFVSKAIACSSELNMFFIGGMMGKHFRVGVYNSQTLRPLKMLPPHKDLLNVIRAIQFGRQFYLFVGSIDGEVSIWNISKGFIKIKSINLQNTVYSIEQIERFAIFGGFFKDFYCWDLSTMSFSRIIDTLGNYYFTSMKYVRKGDYFVVLCSKTGEILTFDWKSGQIIDKRVGHEPSYQVLGLDISASENVMVTGANDGTIKVWEVTKKGVKFSYEIDHRLATEEWKPVVKCIYFLDDDGEQFVGAYADSLLTFWNRGICVPTAKTSAFEMGTGFVYDKPKNLLFCFDYKSGRGYVVAKAVFYPTSLMRYVQAKKSRH